MSLKDQAKSQIHDILTNTDEWGETMTFEDEGSNTGSAAGLYIEHNSKLDEQGVVVIGREGRVTVTEEALTDDAGLTVRDENGDVNMNNWKVTVTHQNGNSVKYRIEWWQPDESLGLIVCYLKDYAAN